MPDWSHMEVKIWRVWNSVVIKRAQLEFLWNKWFYSLVYYRTKDNLPPSYFTSKQTLIKPEAYLKRNIKIESMFIFPQPSIVMFYNTSNLAEWTIRSTGIKHKPLCLSRGIKLYNENELGYEMYEDEVSYGKHQIQIYSLGYNILVNSIINNAA